MWQVDGFSGFCEARADFAARPEIAHVVFDFDGTLSLIREGWPEVMIPMMVEFLPRLPGETDASVKDFLFDDIMRLTGKQTIYQMIQFADRVKERGGQPEEPLWYKHEYLRRLEERIASRLKAMEADPEKRHDYLVHGSEQLLEALTRRGVTLYLASGTDEIYVKREAEMLGLNRFFGDHIYGALDDYKSFSKKMVVFETAIFVGQSEDGAEVRCEISRRVETAVSRYSGPSALRFLRCPART